MVGRSRRSRWKSFRDPVMREEGAGLTVVRCRDMTCTALEKALWLFRFCRYTLLVQHATTSKKYHTNPKTGSQPPICTRVSWYISALLAIVYECSLSSLTLLWYCIYPSAQSYTSCPQSSITASCAPTDSHGLDTMIPRDQKRRPTRPVMQSTRCPSGTAAATATIVYSR